jgi:hypothetical protein
VVVVFWNPHALTPPKYIVTTAHRDQTSKGEITIKAYYAVQPFNSLKQPSSHELTLFHPLSVRAQAVLPFTSQIRPSSLELTLFHPLPVKYGRAQMSSRCFTLYQSELKLSCRSPVKYSRAHLSSRCFTLYQSNTAELT